FFQAEDGIRDYKVTGVQTCALPILDFAEGFLFGQALLLHEKPFGALDNFARLQFIGEGLCLFLQGTELAVACQRDLDCGGNFARSEERRVGKAGRAWRWAVDSKESA